MAKYFRVNQLVVPKRVRLSCISHPVDRGFERLLTAKELTQILPEWILDQTHPTDNEWESARWLAAVICYHNPPDERSSSLVPAWVKVVHHWPLKKFHKIFTANDPKPDGKLIECAPTCDEVLHQIWHEHLLRNEPLCWTPEGAIHTRVRTTFGTYETSELERHSAEVLPTLPSTQVRDYINNRDDPFRPLKLEDLRPDNPVLAHTWEHRRTRPRTDDWDDRLPRMPPVTILFAGTVTPPSPSLQAATKP